MRLNPSEDLFFFRDYHEFRTKFLLCPRISENFFPIHKVLENHDLGKTSLPPRFFWAGMPMQRSCIGVYFERKVGFLGLQKARFLV